jgi:hypothetical protein
MQFSVQDTSHRGDYTSCVAMTVVTPSRPGTAQGGFFVDGLLPLLTGLVLVLILRSPGG